MVPFPSTKDPGEEGRRAVAKGEEGRINPAMDHELRSLLLLLGGGGV